MAERSRLWAVETPLRDHTSNVWNRCPTTERRDYVAGSEKGFSNGYLYRLVIQQSAQLATLGYIPGTLMAALLYAGLRKVTLLPLSLEPTRGILLAVITLLMCAFSATLAVRKLSAADPADVF